MSASASHIGDVVVVGATPGGIATAIRTAREGLHTHLVAFNSCVGGMMSSGLSVTDTTFSPTRSRSPVLDEFFNRIETYYREMFGENSKQYQNCRGGQYFEPKVAEGVFETMLSDAGVTIHREYHPVDVTRNGDTLCRVSFESFHENIRIEMSATTFVDATYEGDLADVAGVKSRIGREGRSEFDEQYAGKIFSEKRTKLYPGSSGVGDDTVQSYDYRLCLSKDPDNRSLPERPNDYDREEYLPMVKDRAQSELEYGKAYESREIPCNIKSELVRPTRDEIKEMGLESYLLLRGPLPNEKRDLNTADLPGEVDDYPDADWERRKEIADRHQSHVLGMLYFLQNDDAVPEDLQREAREWGLPEDEFEDTDNFPFQLYVREARRIIGRDTFTENDARLAEGIERAPINRGSIAIAEYPMDSHDCLPVRRPGSLAEGHFFLDEITVPSQIPFKTLLPKELANLVVPVALSATHVGFGTIRLEPTWMQIGDSAGFAISLADQKDAAPGTLNSDTLQRYLVDNGSMITFFDDVDLDEDDVGIDASQYLGTKGFFRTYDARLNEPLSSQMAEQWTRLAATISTGSYTPNKLARSLPTNKSVENDSVTVKEFHSKLVTAFERAELPTDAIRNAINKKATNDDGPVSRGEACDLIYEILSESSRRTVPESTLNHPRTTD